MKQTLPSFSSRSPTLVKNMISGLSYGALNASYQVVDWSPAQCPPTPSLSLQHTGLQKRHSPTLPGRDGAQSG